MVDNDDLLKLLKPIAEWYEIRLAKEKEKMDSLAKNEKSLFENWKKFGLLDTKKVINEISNLMQKSIMEKQYRHLGEINFFGDLSDYFFSLGIDVNLGIENNVTIGDKIYNYFSFYGLNEKMKWNKIQSELRLKLESIKKEGIIDEYKSKIDLFFNKAIEMSLQDVTMSHIKCIADELGEDVNRIVQQLQLAVSVRLKKYWSNNLPKYHKRGITNSRRIDVFSRDGYKCDQCGRTKEEIGMTTHHITPESLGGTDEMDNLITVCVECNGAIGNSKYSPSNDWINKIGKHIYKRWKKTK